MHFTMTVIYLNVGCVYTKQLIKKIISRLIGNENNH